MNRQINLFVDGSHLTKDRGTAGVQHEGNSTTLRIKFDESWDNLAKSVTWWNARGLNPVVRVLTTDMLEDIKTSTRVYLCPIPAEPLTEAGMCTFVIDGFLDGKRQRSISDQLKVTAAPYAANAGAAADPTPTQAEQLQVQMEAVLGDIQRAIVASDTAGAAIEEAAAALQSAARARAEAELAEAKAKEAQSLVESTIYHAPRHAAGGEDPITPEMINAATVEAVNAAQSAAQAAQTAANNAQAAATAAQTAANTAQNTANAAATAAANAQATANGKVSQSGDGSISGQLRVARLTITDYSQPLEAPQYIDFHVAGSAADYDGRLSIDGAGNIFYNTSKLMHEGMVTKSTVDIGAGVAMAQHSWYAVYE